MYVAVVILSLHNHDQPFMISIQPYIKFVQSMFFKGFQRFSKLMANEFWREILHASSKAGVPYGRIIHCNIWSLLQFVE